MCFIDCRGDAPAYAIVLSGGYKDDRDEGSSFWYTGEGGQKAGKQARVLVTCDGCVDLLCLR